MKKKIYYLIFFLILYLILLELIFFLLPTSEVFSRNEVNNENRLLSYKENEDIIFSNKWNFKNIVNKKTNNYGFINSIDYKKDGNPDLMVIGDSYVDAYQVNNKDSITEQLSNKIKNFNVYSLSMSGSALSQYLYYAEFAEINFNPKEYLFLIVHNDFDESICKYKKKEGAHCFNEYWELELIDFNGYGFWKSLMRKSSVIRYLILNVRINYHKILINLNIRKKSENINSSTDYNQKVDVSKFMINKFFMNLRKIIPDKKITLMLDGDRMPIYIENFKKDQFFNTMKDEVKNKSSLFNIEIIDLDPIFRKHYEKNKKWFEIKNEGHWNKLGHTVAADSYINFKKLSNN